MPNVFKSYRFLDYLLSVPESKDYPEYIQHELKTIRSLCVAPAYLTPSYNARRYQEETKMSPSSDSCDLDSKKTRKSI